MPRIHRKPLVSVWVGWVVGLLSVVTAQAQSSESPAQPQSQSVQSQPRAVAHAGSGEVGLAGEFPDRYRGLDLEDGGQVPALYFAAQTVPAKGAIVLLSDAGQGAASEFAQGLGRRLSDSGWAVVSLGLEAPASGLERLLEEPGKAPGDADPAKSGKGSVMIDVMKGKSPDDAVAAYRTRVLQALTAALTFASDEGYSQPVLVGVGYGAGHALEQAVSQPGTSALVWVAPDFYPTDASVLPETLSEAAGLSVLELSPAERMGEARVRSVSVRKSGFPGYSLQPVAMASPPGEASAHAVANRILAWLAKQLP